MWGEAARKRRLPSGHERDGWSAVGVQGSFAVQTSHPGGPLQFQARSHLGAVRMKQLKVNTCLAVVVVASLLSACAQKRVMTLAAAPSDLFDPAAPIEVTGSQVVAKRHGDVIAGAGEGAGKGMLAGAGGSILGGASTGNPAGLALGIFLAPVFAVGGGIYGAAAAHPAEETNAAVAAIERVYADDKLLGALTRDVENQVHSLGFPAPQPCSGQQEGASTVTPTTGDCSPGPSNRLRISLGLSLAGARFLRRNQERRPGPSVCHSSCSAAVGRKGRG